ncbi:MAG: hypothetical protein P4L71_01265 [Acetobacteraceae bacterium]|nr:hypothetical protein [Acetobacteraceae bacterium]
MFESFGAVSIALGSVVLDSPDQTGRYFAKDLAGGWAYLVGDAAGDNRFRGHGVCDGGLDMTLRCAFLSASSRIPDWGRISILVETREAHRMMVQLAVRDPYVVATIAGRPVSVMTRPEARSSYQVRSAAERAASVALRDRERAGWHTATADEEAIGPADRNPEVVAVDTGVANPGAATGEDKELGSLRNWRARRDLERQAPSRRPGAADVHMTRTMPPPPVLNGTVRGLVRPLVEGARNRLVAAGLWAPPAPRRSRAVMEWLKDFDGHLTAVTHDLQDAGA